MNEPQKSKGPWFHRVLVLSFSLLLGILIYWLLGFVMKDIGTWPGPNYGEVEKRLLNQDLVERLAGLQRQIEEVNRNVAADRKRQENLRDSTSNSERTMTHLLEIQRLKLQKDLTLDPEEQAALAQSKQLFLANQKKYQEINEKIAQSSEQLNELERQFREAYENFFCPVCGFPIRRGPLKYLSWNRRSLKRLGFVPEAQGASDEPYVCPACGTRLFEECDGCHAVRHSLLPACTKCGREKPLPAPATPNA